MHQGHDLGQILWSHAQIDAHGTGVAVSLTRILAIQDRRDFRRKARIENLLGIRNTCRNAGDDLRIGQLLEGFVFGHAGILT